MNKIKILGIIAVIISIVLISGCTGSNGSNTKTYKICNSTFQIPEEWDTPGLEYELFSRIPFSYNYDDALNLEIEQYQKEYDYNYWLESAKVVNEGSKSNIIDISGINITLVQYSTYSPGRDIDGNNYEYYFQKNGKYFKLHIDDYRENKEEKTINETANTIITTMK